MSYRWVWLMTFFSGFIEKVRARWKIRTFRFVKCHLEKTNELTKLLKLRNLQVTTMTIRPATVQLIKILNKYLFFYPSRNGFVDKLAIKLTFKLVLSLWTLNERIWKGQKRCTKGNYALIRECPLPNPSRACMSLIRSHHENFKDHLAKQKPWQ